MTYEPIVKSVIKRRKTVLLCPFKFSNSIPEDKDCIKGDCAFWLPIQRACCIQVLARGYIPRGS